MSFCKKGLHSFLSFTSFDDTTTLSPSPLAIGLASATRNSLRPPNVLESTTVGPPPPPVPPLTPSPVFADGYGLRKDTGGILTLGFFEEVGEVVDGLMSCTESLGFESSDERRVDEGVHDMGKDGGGKGGGGGGENLDVRPSCVLSRAKRREGSSKKVRDRKFPPPIKSLNDMGQPSFFLRALRRDGRLELEEVRIDRHEILRASRADGRLRLEFVEEMEAGELGEDSDKTNAVTGEEEYEQVEEEEEEGWTLGYPPAKGSEGVMRWSESAVTATTTCMCGGNIA